MATIDVKDAANQTVAIEKPLAPGRAAAAASRPVVLSTEDLASLAAIVAAIEALPAGDASAANQETAIAGLASILAKLSSDPATQTTLAAVLAKMIAAPATEAKQDAIIALLGTTLPAEVVGSVAAAATDSGKPVKTGGVYNSTAPTYTTGQRGETQLDTRGNTKVVLTGLNGNLSPTVGTPSAFGQSAQSGLFVAAENLIHNGSSYDLMAKPNAASRIASAAATTNPTSAKGSAGNVFRVAGNNVKASVVYLKLYNKATAPTVGTDVPVLTIPIAASGVFNIDIGGTFGFYLGTGIAYGFTTDAADNGTTALAAGDILDFCLTYA